MPIPQSHLTSLPPAGGRTQAGGIHPLLLLSLLVALLIGIPVLGVLSNLFAGSGAAPAEGSTFVLLWSTVLPEYLFNSLVIAGIVLVLFLAVLAVATWARWLRPRRR